MKVYKTKEYRIMSVTSGKLLTANEDQLITVEAADEQKAQIEDIVTRKTERNVSDIVITTME